eukprot:5849401-Pyramimonas_sp.AAC.1
MMRYVEVPHRFFGSFVCLIFTWPTQTCVSVKAALPNGRSSVHCRFQTRLAILESRREGAEEPFPAREEPADGKGVEPRETLTSRCESLGREPNSPVVEWLAKADKAPDKQGQYTHHEAGPERRAYDYHTHHEGVASGGALGVGGVAREDEEWHLHAVQPLGPLQPRAKRDRVLRAGVGKVVERYPVHGPALATNLHLDVCLHGAVELKVGRAARDGVLVDKHAVGDDGVLAVAEPHVDLARAAELDALD